MTDYSYLLLSCGIMSLVVGQSIDGKPGARLDGCVGQDIEISWNFIDEANLNIATWSVISSSFTGNILRKFGSASASVLNSYNVVHNGNGKITLTSVTSDNSGNFTLSVTYSTGPGPGEDTVEVIANEAPTATLRWEDGSCQFDGGTTLDLVLSEEVNGTGKYCCVTGGAAACINGSTEPTYCIEDCKCDCCIHKIVWIVVSTLFSLPSLGWTLFVLKDARRKIWLNDNLGEQAHHCMIGWVVLNLVYSIIAAILFCVLVCKNDCCEEECDCICNCWPVYIIIGYVVKPGDVIVIVIGVVAFINGTNERNLDQTSKGASKMEDGIH